MKKPFSLLITLVFIMMVVSCRKNELTYSCNSEIDSYVKDNIELFENCNVLALTEYDLGIQKAAYRTYLEESKYDLWVERLDIISLDSMFSSIESQHIQNLTVELYPEIFEGDSELFNQFIIFYESWEKVALEQLGWDKQLLAYVVSSMELNYNSYLESLETLNYSAVTLSQGCGCNQTHDFCDGGALCNGSCSSVSGGCGVLWMEDCNGTCIFQD